MAFGSAPWTFRTPEQDVQRRQELRQVHDEEDRQREFQNTIREMSPRIDRIRELDADKYRVQGRQLADSAVARIAYNGYRTLGNNLMEGTQRRVSQSMALRDGLDMANQTRQRVLALGETGTRPMPGAAEIAQRSTRDPRGTGGSAFGPLGEAVEGWEQAKHSVVDPLIPGDVPLEAAVGPLTVAFPPALLPVAAAAGARALGRPVNIPEGVAEEGIVQAADPLNFAPGVGVGTDLFRGVRGARRALPLADDAVRAGTRVTGIADDAARGITRLYRGESGSRVIAPEWVRQGQQQMGITDAIGRWFTDDIENAAWYAQEAGESGRITYVDVPTSQVDALRVANNPTAARFSRDPHREFFVPSDIAAASKPLDDAARGIGPGTFAPIDNVGSEALKVPEPAPIVEEAVTPATSGVRKITDALGQTRRNIEQTQIARTAEHAQRGSAYEDAFRVARAEGLNPVEANRRASTALAGEYTAQPGALADLDPDEVSGVWSLIDSSPLRNLERKNARDALTKLADGEPITGYYVGLLEKVYGKPFADAIRASHKKGPEGVWGRLYDLAVAPKALLSSFDFSYPFRQGAMLAPRRNKEFVGSFGSMFKAALKEDNAQRIAADLVGDDMMIPVRTGAGVADVPLGQIRDQTGLLRELSPASEAAEEAFRSNLAERIPGIGRIVRASNRAFTTFGNKFRADVQKTILKKWIAQGVEITPERLQALSNMLNRFTGRGTLNNSRVTQFMQAAWWAPQYRVSGPQAMATMLHRDPQIRGQAIQNFAAFFGTGTALLGAASMAPGVTVSLNPFSPDFGKVRAGNTRINIWGTNQLLARTVAQAIFAQRFDPELGMNIPLDTKGQKPIGGRLDVLQRYFESGLAPEWGAIWDIAHEENYLGEPIKPDLETAIREGRNRLLPITAQEIVEAVLEEGPKGAATAPLSLFGVGVSSYGSSVTDQLQAIPKYRDLTPQQIYQIERLWDEAEVEKKRIRSEYGADVPIADVIKNFGPEQGYDPTVVLSAVALRSTKVQQQALNPEWLQFVVEHADELRERQPGLMDNNLIIDAIRRSRGESVPAP